MAESKRVGFLRRFLTSFPRGYSWAILRNFKLLREKIAVSEAENKAEITHAIHDERLVTGAGVRVVGVPKADQRPRTQSDTLPAHEHEQHVVCRHEQQHGERKEVQIGEVAPQRAVLVHVPNGVEMD